MLSMLLPFFFPQTDEREVLYNRITSAPLAPVVLHEKELRDRGVASLSTVYACCMYDDEADIRRAIHLLKYCRAKQAATALGYCLSRLPIDHTNATLCPVPLHWSRQFSRGFNQAELLARECAHRNGASVRMALRRVRPTGHQAHRTKDERQHALRHAFAIRKNMSMPEHVVLLDDVGTTLSTLEECARILLAAGTKKVDAVVVALA